MSRRVVVTGIGLITPLAADVDNTWSKLIEGKSGIKAISTDRFDSSDLTCRVAGQVPTQSDDIENYFNPLDYISEKDLKRTDRFIHYGFAAAVQAVEDSLILENKNINKERIGVAIGSGIGGLPSIQENVITMQEKGPRRVSPFFVPASLINLISGHISIKYEFIGPNDSAVTACATGAHAIINSARAIKLGEADIMIAGGAESALCRVGIAGFASMKALSTKFNDNPEEASRPWDEERDGFVMGEGAGILVLEEYEHAKKREAKIYAELTGYGLTGDAHHITAPHPEGRGALKAMELALRSAQVSPSQIGYINAHGTSTTLGDKVEVIAMKQLFGDYAYKIPVSSTKSSIGHLLGAAGSVEAIFSILALNNGIVPPTLNLHKPSEGCDLNFVPLKAQEHKIQYALSNSFGFGGTNASLIFGKV
ncbi:beta-ketoacyl-ACP synthase II [Wolbachia endosymbiont of Diaphorina citri]|jgi:beta-ketoacyl-acyl-carrier-protein synthase II|uniref:beta-ketoacyl-ACP synthase II n=1 Tax=Wolbachia endosymbiont of Diaphorina citri TaxID=116598 RepID=UPI0002EFEBAE|nr:beta-ketoacyl-ACP synthase II [Wolbachia endosymbiont of Diaphorina citri]QJT94506.1 beta-ketoacyl-ACP synthase II [Wolbachia endosymbiont of Diaphorina citri]QJT95747.1 beta-ketoacyl-ACP synthase II [Wolbachia endosymbiont of Diaphorina citri]QJT97109.1 beta-ketoacyl-ACP synthase II [Wolbachia endosymbiont of Diaphorina citri]QLK11403.1 beta-ketoacyl-ACP synthase II [Wolbachia endosymbiont of Diaphorina citri]QXY87063.1 beta-ketoacyl-ACP synthase II [Wolbachia endosymbiont of Diaphorina ci